MRIAGSVSIVTGASSGIGAATAHELARRGGRVVLAARRADALEALAAEIRGQGGAALVVPTDVTRRDEIDRLVRAALDAYGRVDVLVNNAGLGGPPTLADTPDDELRRVIEVNLLAAARCAQAVLPSMRKQGRGVIVNLGSVAGEVAGPGVYSATKFGLRGLSDGLRREVRHLGIAVVLVEPGFIRTPMTAGLRVPMPGPAVVARTIAGAIERPRRRVVVPWPYLPMMYLGKLLPWLVDLATQRARRRPWRRPG